jgi:predicted anti-sigma-YlaC factor YlaD
MAKKCPDYINELNDYLDGAIDPELCAEIEEHIGQCENCRIMVDTMKQTVKLCREGKAEKLPPSLENKLSGLLKKRWEKKFGKTE